MYSTNDLIRILVIDDEEVVRNSLCFQLEDLGYSVLTAANGKQGVDLFEQHRLDLVLTDLRMPGMDGFAVIKHLSQKKPDLPIIVISGAGRITEAIDALRLGADDYLVKPVGDLEMLHHRVKSALEKAQLVFENREYQERLEQLLIERSVALVRANFQVTNINNRLRNVAGRNSEMSSYFDVKAFESLCASERRYRTLFESSGEATFLVDRESGCYQDANEAALRLAGRSLEQLQSMSAKDILSERLFEQLNALDEANPLLDLGKVSYHRSDGSLCQAQVSVLLLDQTTVAAFAKEETGG